MTMLMSTDANDLPDISETSDEIILDYHCPKCGREYDEIDYEYQICHLCKYSL